MLQPGDNIDIWVVEKSLGSGGMGSVYRCHNRTAHRILAAVKTLDSGLRKSSGAEERFIREAEILFRIDHPNVVKVRNIRTDSDPPYLEMEFVEGESLEGMLERGAIPLTEAIEFAEQLADAVTYLHNEGIRHRDIKPANILITKAGKLKLVDFGLAMEADVTRITQTGMSFGTVSYAPPEWVYPETIDPVLWDIYAMGVVLWEMLTGGVAFPVSGQGTGRQQAMQVMLQKQKHEPLDPGTAFQEPVRALVRDMTQSDAALRPKTASAILQRVKAIDRSNQRPTGATIVAPEGAGNSLQSEPPKPRRSVMAVSAEPATAQRKETGQTWVEGAHDTHGPGPAGPLTIGPEVHVAPAPDPVAPPAAKAKTRPTPVVEDAPKIERQPTLPTPSSPPSRVPMLLGASALGISALVLLIVVVVIGGWWALSGRADRDVDVAVSGLPNGTPITLSVSDLSASKRDAWVFGFRGVPIGKAPVIAVIGEGCAATCAAGGACESWCGVQRLDTSVIAGDGTQTVVLQLEPPTMRPIDLTVDGHPEIKAELRRDGRPVGELAPGKYALTAIAGEATWNVDVTIPWGTGKAAVAIAAPPLVPTPPRPDSKVEAKIEAKVPVDTKVDTKIEAKAETKVDPAPKAAGTSGKLVTNGELGKWIAKNTEYQHDAAIGAGIADANYLAGWSYDVPPAGHEGDPAVNVSWYVAQAYCRANGGNLPLENAEPATWTESGATPSMEWRVTDAKKAVFRGSEGMVGPTGRAAGNAITGFRCAR